jgi:Asp-tRNA(Asn)/Glu-tRNA(Gln) amidotransferase A subunit family amidase
VVPANLLGLPLACVPAGRVEGTGLPIGVLITGRRLREHLCLEAAEAIETRLGVTTSALTASHFDLNTGRVYYLCRWPRRCEK